MPTKLKPALTKEHLVRGRLVSSRLARLLAPRAGCLLLVHAAAGYGKTTALAMTHEPDWLWYNLDRADGAPVVLGARLSAALDLEPISPDMDADGEAVAAALAQRLQGRPLTITFDRFQHLGEAPEVGRMLAELAVLLPALSLRVATRTRPALPLTRLRLEGRLVEVGPAEMRLQRDEVEELLTDAMGRPPSPAELEFADAILAGWPAALHLWLAGLEGESDLMAPLRPGKPLHDYLHEEVFEGTLSAAAMDRLRSELAWLAGSGPLLERAATPAARVAADILVRDRVGVVPMPGGWCLHPAVACFLDMHLAYRRNPREAPPAPPVAAVSQPETNAGSRVVVNALGGLAVAVNQVPVDEAAWPTAARRLLELLLCLPGCQTTAQQAARLLWPRHLARSALNSFNVALHGLRRVLEPDLTAGADSRYVVRQGRVYRLSVERLTCDVEEFLRLVRQMPQPLDEEAGHRLEGAVSLYAGDFLASSSEDFAREKRARLRRVMLETLERLGEWHAEASRGDQALRALNRLLELAPHREDVWARVLELYVAAGDEYRALAALQHCEQSLRAEGIEPSGLLRELHQRIRREAPPAAERRYGT